MQISHKKLKAVPLFKKHKNKKNVITSNHTVEAQII